MRHKFPPSWPTRSFKEVAEVITGTTPLTSHPEYYGGSIPFIGPAELGGVELITQSPKSLSDDGVKQARLLPAEAVLVCCIGATIGKVGFSGTELATNQQINALVCNKNIVFPRYVFHYCQTLTSLIRHLGASTTLPLLTKGRFQEMEIPVPILEEQRRIAEILDRAQSLISKRREAIGQLDILTKAIFLEMFGDPVTNPKEFTIRKIKDLLESASYGTSEKSSFEGEFPVLRMNNITRTGEIDLTDLKYMDLADSQKERYLVRSGDVLFNRTNSAELVGKTAIIRNISNPMAFAGYLVRLRVNKENDPEYISAFLNTDYSKRVLRGMCKSIIGMANINATEVQTIKIAQPPLPLQQEFAHRIEAVEKLKAAHRASLSELDALFASLQHCAFRGEL